MQHGRGKISHVSISRHLQIEAKPKAGQWKQPWGQILSQQYNTKFPPPLQEYFGFKIADHKVTKPPGIEAGKPQSFPPPAGRHGNDRKAADWSASGGLRR
jgi:hypothetical protein